MSEKRERVVVCGANAYEQKYYFNQEFSRIPQSLQEELRIICVLYTQEVGGIFTIVFDEEGELVFETQADEFDITYDEVSSGLLISEIRRNRAELLESLELYYRVFICGESIDGLLDGSDDQTEG
ncbi:MAG: hypothetical protein J5509_08840 [Lachnospiraceae bacterium]|nr:hypothetical protein [Lachnospiraceae bacterium]